MTTDTELTHWSTRAINLPDHANNLIHTDEGARAAGFPGALVAGATIYAYMTHPPAAAWGPDWLSGGGGELQLRRPIFDDDLVDCVISTDDGDSVVSATVDGDARSSLRLWKQADAPAIRSGDPLKPLNVHLSEAHIDYGLRCGDDLSLYAEQNIAHPVTWVDLANRVFIDNLVTGPWIHVRSKIYHEGLAPIGAQIRIESNLLDRFESRAGERALVDIRIFAADQPIATIEHEAIIVLPS
jgi:hypothetical protein